MKQTLKQLKQSIRELESLLEKPRMKTEFAREAKDLEEAVSMISSVRRRIKSKVKEAEAED